MKRGSLTFFVIVYQPLVGQGRHIEASHSYSDTPHSVGLVWTSDQPVAKPLPYNTTVKRERHP